MGSRDELFMIRTEKLRLQILSAKRIIRNKKDPVRIADSFIHSISLIIKNKLKVLYPSLNESEINEKLKMRADFLTRLKKKRTRGRNLSLK